MQYLDKHICIPIESEQRTEVEHENPRQERKAAEIKGARSEIRRTVRGFKRRSAAMIPTYQRMRWLTGIRHEAAMRSGSSSGPTAVTMLPAPGVSMILGTASIGRKSDKGDGRFEKKDSSLVARGNC